MIRPVQKARNGWPLLVSMGFVVVLAVSLLNDNYLALAMPLVVIVAYIAIFHPFLLLCAIAFCTPFSLNLEELGIGGIAFYFPTEPLLAGFLIVLLLGHWHSRLFHTRVINHPITRVLLCWLGWVLFTSLTSVDPLVSIKFFLARLWFVIPIFLFGATLFLDHRKRLPFLLSLGTGLLLVVAFTTIKHMVRGFDEESAHWIMEPFFRDHTQYAAVIAISIPLLLGGVLQKSFGWFVRLFCLLGLLLISIAIIYTYSRAAWLSIVLALGILVAVKLKIKARLIVSMAFLVTAAIIVSFDSIMLELRKNQTDSSDDLIENVESITNISTDASNLERLNRWNAVFAMAKERPLLGFGPGTYMFEYAPFQKSNDLTIISTNFGDVGNAHSEYLGPLAEMGIPGFLLTIYLVYLLFMTAYRTYHRLQPGLDRSLLLYCTLGLATYFIHGILNNFLDADKASVPVFALMALVVAIDLSNQKSAVDS